MGTMTTAELLRNKGETAFIADIKSVPSEDPLSYAHGFARALWNDDPTKGHLSILKGLSKAFKAGFQHGGGVRRGEKPMPTWVGSSSSDDEESLELR